MKRFTAMLVLICMLLSGCSLFGERILEPVTFYYLEADYQYGREGSVFVSEQREASGHRNDLSYLMALYLMGPSDEAHVSPLPRGTRIFRLENTGKTVSMELSQHARSLTDAQFSVACACLSMTCLELTTADQVSISDGERTVNIGRENLTLHDDSKAISTKEETQ